MAVLLAGSTPLACSTGHTIGGCCSLHDPHPLLCGDIHLGSGTLSAVVILQIALDHAQRGECSFVLALLQQRLLVVVYGTSQVGLGRQKVAQEKVRLWLKTTWN